jgi:hypothetical protein
MNVGRMGMTMQGGAHTDAPQRQANVGATGALITNMLNLLERLWQVRQAMHFGRPLPHAEETLGQIIDTVRNPFQPGA